MSAFRFSLGRLLDLRRNEEHRRATHVAAARRDSDSAMKAREDLVRVCQAGRAKVAEAHQLGGAVGVLRNMELLLERGVSAFYEIGPGRVLAGLMRRIQRRTDFTSVNSADAVAKLAE